MSTEAISGTVYAGFWIRLLATAIDVLILVVILAVPLTWIYGMSYWVDISPVKGFWDVVLNYIAPAFLTIWLWLQFKATPGKMILGLEIVDAETLGKIKIKQAAIRYFSYIPSILCLCLGFIWIAFDKRKQSWHDKLANSVVIYKNSIKAGD